MTGVRDVVAVLVAAGRGERLGAAADRRGKALVEVAGRSLLAHAWDALRRVARVGTIVAVHPPGGEGPFRAVVGDDAILVPGGETRSASVLAGLAALPPTGATAVAIHDVARAFVPPEVVLRTIEAVTGEVIAAAPGLPVVDTVKRVDRQGRVLATVERDGLWAVQTPQVIRHDVVAAVLAAAPAAARDDLGLVEDAVAAGAVEGEVVLVHGDPRGLKVTYPDDLRLAAVLVDEAYGG